MPFLLISGRVNGLSDLLGWKIIFFAKLMSAVNLMNFERNFKRKYQAFWLDPIKYSEGFLTPSNRLPYWANSFAISLHCNLPNLSNLITFSFFIYFTETELCTLNLSMREKWLTNRLYGSTTTNQRVDNQAVRFMNLEFLSISWQALDSSNWSWLHLIRSI